MGGMQKFKTPSRHPKTFTIPAIYALRHDIPEADMTIGIRPKRRSAAEIAERSGRGDNNSQRLETRAKLSNDI